MQEESPLDRAIGIVADLRERCSWDRAQNRRTLRPYLIEEAHELSAALESGEPEAIREEVGDLMLHLAWQMVLGSELGEFTPAQIADDVVAKMQRRHPHLYDLGPREGWEELKRKEKPERLGTLSGLPATLPSLLMAFRLQERAAKVGFDWPDFNGPVAKVHEELAEVEAELVGLSPGESSGPLEGEIGDLMFAVVNLARKAGIQPELALDRANAKFRRRFEQIETAATERGLVLGQASLEELDAIWDEVKMRERTER